MITLEEVRLIHSAVIEFDRINNPADYVPGERYIAIIESMLEYRMSEEKSVYQNAAIALHTIASRHAFNNGNKRTAGATALILLKNEGIHFTINEEAKTNFIIDIATPQKNITVETVEEWLKKNTEVDSKLDIIGNGSA